MFRSVGTWSEPDAECVPTKRNPTQAVFRFGGTQAEPGSDQVPVFRNAKVIVSYPRDTIATALVHHQWLELGVLSAPY